MNTLRCCALCYVFIKILPFNYNYIPITFQLHYNLLSPVHQVFSTNANVYIVLELAPNGELFDYVNQFAVLSEKVAANLFRQLLLGRCSFTPSLLYSFTPLLFHSFTFFTP